MENQIKFDEIIEKIVKSELIEIDLKDLLELENLTREAFRCDEELKMRIANLVSNLKELVEYMRNFNENNEKNENDEV